MILRVRLRVTSLRTALAALAFLLAPSLGAQAADETATAPSLARGPRLDPIGEGARLFAQQCAACHGASGSGGVGVPLSLPDLLAVVDDQYLYKTIRLGRPGRVMPAFRQLSDAQVDAIVHYIRGWARTPHAAPVTVHPGDPGRGKTLFATHCASCHGANGEGGHGTGVTFSRPRDLPILPPALNNPGFLAASSDGMIKATLLRGREGTPMKSFLKQGLTERDVDDVVAYVRSFQKTPPDTGVAALESEPPVLVRESPYSVAETVEKLKTAFSAANMRVIRAVPFDQGFVDKSKENPKQMIVDACDFDFLNKALAVDPRVGLFLPCRVTVTEHDGKVLVMTVNPARLSAIFNNSELNQLCERMHRIYSDILDESTM